MSSNTGASPSRRPSIVTRHQDPDPATGALGIAAAAAPQETLSETSSLLQPIPATSPHPHSLTGSYHRPSYFTTGPRGTVVLHSQEPELPTAQERHRVLEDERDLLVDNHVISVHAHAHAKKKSWAAPSGGSGLLSRGLKGVSPSHQARDDSEDEEEEATANEWTTTTESSPAESTTLLVPTRSMEQVSRRSDDSFDLEEQWEAAVRAGLIRTTWKREGAVIARYTAPLMVTFILQYTLTVVSVFAVGHLGKVELGAVSLGSMTAQITGFAVYQGLATSLDTLCAQAYGSGRKDLVGLHTQRMILFLWIVTIPIGLLWYFADRLLVMIVPEHEVVILAGQYLKVMIWGAPAYACFESGKRFVQAQGIFSASLVTLLLATPINIFLSWFFVWKLEWGFVGAPLAVAITDNLLPVFLFLYIYFIDGRDCWYGFSDQIFTNWGPMIRLAFPGFVMVEAEVLAFEILTLAAAYFGTTALAAQAVLSTISAITFQIPFPLSIAGSTRIANLIGATLTGAARTSAKVTLSAAVLVGMLNFTFLSLLRWQIPRLFTNDPEVIELVATVLPLCASFQVVDAIAANCNGILRGLGRQAFGGYVQFFCYYVVAMPISMGTAFGLGWQLWGLWTGVAIALLLVAVIETVFLLRMDWERSVVDARKRNEMDW